MIDQLRVQRIRTSRQQSAIRPDRPLAIVSFLAAQQQSIQFGSAREEVSPLGRRRLSRGGLGLRVSPISFLMNRAKDYSLE